MARPATAAVRLLTGEREPVRLATTANIDVDTGGLLVIDGVQTAVGDRVLVKDQTDGAENGIRTVSAGQWYRAADARTSRTLQKGTTVTVQEGTANAGKTFRFATLDPQIGDDALVIVDALTDLIGNLNATAKPVIVDADRVFGSDSAAALGLIYTTWAQIKSFLFASSALTGVPTAPTATPGTNTAQLATTGFVKAAIDVVLGGVSAAFDTLSEIATDLGLKMVKTANLSDVTSVPSARLNILVPTYVATRTALKALDTTKDVAAILLEAGRQGIFKWTTGDYSALVTADTQEGYVVKATAIASTVGAWVRVTTTHIPEHFGAISDWTGTAGTSTNNATALQKMLDVAKITGLPMVISDGPGFYCNATLTISNMDFVMSGAFGASRIVFGTGATDGLVITQDTFEHSTHILSLTITTLGQETGAGLKVTYGSTDATNNRNQPRCLLRDLDIRGETLTSTGWQDGIVLTDVHNASVIRPVITGRRDTGFTDQRSFNLMRYGVRIVGSVGAIPSDIEIGTPKIYHTQEAISISGEVEGVIVDKPVLVGVITGVKGRCTSARPWIQVRGGHINCFQFGIDIQNCPQGNYADLLIYKFQTTTLATVGIKLDTCAYSTINNIRLINQATDAVTNGEWDAVQLVSSDFCSIDGIVHDRPSRTVAISGTGANSETRNIRKNGSFTSATVAIYLDTSSNANFRIGGCRKVVSAKNGAITVTAAPTTVATSGSLAVNKGERFLVHGMVNTTKGATAGEFLTSLDKTGTATATFDHDRASVVQRQAQAISATISQVVSAIVNVTASGTLTINLNGTATGSNSDVLAGDGQLTIEML